MIEDLWNKSVEFHGHGCPGLAVGVRVCEAILSHERYGQAPYGSLMCVTENDACCVDAVQRVLGCSLGKGNLVFKDVGKMAFTFYEPGEESGLRVIYLPQPQLKDLTMEERQEAILSKPLSDLFKFSTVKTPRPEEAKCFETIVCEKCGEGAAESRIRLENGKKLCLDCYEAYERRW